MHQQIRDEGDMMRHCRWCDADLKMAARHIFIQRFHWPDHIDSRVYHVRCARCCDQAVCHNPRKPRGRPRPEPPTCCVCGQQPVNGTNVVHLTPVTNVPMRCKDGTVDMDPNQCHAEQIYCSDCMWLALHPVAALTDMIERYHPNAWAHPGPHPLLVEYRRRGKAL